MSQFKPRVPVVTQAPRVLVDAGLRPGRHRFQLMVLDGSGRLSKPCVVLVEVKANERK